MGGLWVEDSYEEVIEPQKIVEYCRKNQFDTIHFKHELDLGTLSEISRIILEERVKSGDKKAGKILNL